MSRTCTVCKNADRLKIDKAIMAAVPLRTITAQFGCSASALQRHKPHILREYSRALKEGEPGKQIVEGPPAQEVQNAAFCAVGEIKDLKRRALGYLDAAEKAGLQASALGWFRELRSTIELLCKVRIAEAQQAREFPQDAGNLERSPEWIDLKTRMLTALLPFGAARAALLAAMRAGDQTILEDRVSPAVQRLIDETMSTDPAEPREDRRPPRLLEADRPPAEEKPPTSDNAPHGERRAVQRIWYRCTSPTSHAGLNWTQGQIVDGSRLEIYPPPMNGCWEPFSARSGIPGAPPSGGLKGTKP